MKRNIEKLQEIDSALRWATCSPCASSELIIIVSCSHCASCRRAYIYFTAQTTELTSSKLLPTRAVVVRRNWTSTFNSSRWLQHKSVCRNVIIKTTSCSEQKRRLHCGAAADESQKSLEKTLNLVPLSWRFYSPLGRLLPRALSTFNQLATTLRLHSNYSILSQCLSLSLWSAISCSPPLALCAPTVVQPKPSWEKETHEKKIFEQGAEKSGEEEKKEKLWKIN